MGNDFDDVISNSVYNVAVVEKTLYGSSTDQQAIDLLTELEATQQNGLLLA